MPKAKLGYYFFVVCVNCGKEIILRDAPSPKEKELPKMRSIETNCSRCGAEHTYHPSKVGRGRRARMAMDALKVVVDGTSITVTMPGTDFAVTYQKRFANPHLVLTRSWIAGSVNSPAISQFRARAFHAAVDKARELGWIK